MPELGRGRRRAADPGAGPPPTESLARRTSEARGAEELAAEQARAGPATEALTEARETGTGEPLAGVAFRPLEAGDLRQVVALERRVFNTPWDVEAFRAFLQAGGGFSRLAVAGGQVVGYALGWCVGVEAELMNLAVDPQWRGRSLGGTLLRWVLETCARRGARDVYLDVRASNEAAQRLYRRHGFEPFGRRRGYYRNPREDALVYRARLPRARVR